MGISSSRSRSSRSRRWAIWPSSSRPSSCSASRNGRCAAFALVTSLLGLLLFRDLAARLLGKVPMLLAVGVFAMSYYPVRHAAECKPYGSDLTASLVLVWLAVCWWQNRANRRWLWGLVVAGPMCIAVSYPTVFVAGGVSIALAGTVWQSRDRRVGIPFVVYNVFIAGTFLALLRLVTAGQYAATQDFMLDYWAEGFPPWAPWKLVPWLASLHAGEMMAYPVGDDHFGSTLSLVCFVAGFVVLVRRNERTILALVLALLALAFAAAALHRYPYGGARLSQYYAPLACLMIGLGGASLIGLASRIESRRRILGISVAVLFVIGAAMLARDMSHPYKRLVDYEHRGFAPGFGRRTPKRGKSSACTWTWAEIFTRRARPKIISATSAPIRPRTAAAGGTSIYRNWPRHCRPSGRCAA